ncbi:hypothetical protein DFH09DRAFT_1110465 [Mycena vulgaris]|nr:hypothetical protein DFH09DRAFT_1110465 [Mycena vulgaris]
MHQRLEFVYGIPTFYPVLSVATAIIVDLGAPKFDEYLDENVSEVRVPPTVKPAMRTKFVRLKLAKKSVQSDGTFMTSIKPNPCGILPMTCSTASELRVPCFSAHAALSVKYDLIFHQIFELLVGVFDPKFLSELSCPKFLGSVNAVGELSFGQLEASGQQMAACGLLFSYRWSGYTCTLASMDTPNLASLLLQLLAGNTQPLLVAAAAGQASQPPAANTPAVLVASSPQTLSPATIHPSPAPQPIATTQIQPYQSL